jgi:hypothetical protein
VSTNSHNARVLAEPGKSDTWLVTCDLCPWLEDIAGPWTERGEAQLKAREHEQDPDPDAIHAVHLFFQAGKKYNEERAEDLKRESEEELERERANYVFGKK